MGQITHKAMLFAVLGATIGFLLRLHWRTRLTTAILPAQQSTLRM